MTITARILRDTRSPCGARMTTFELKYPRFIHAELMTHRALSRNAASSRAIPIETMIRAVWREAALPVFWGANEKGMQANTELKGWRLKLAKASWHLFAKLSTIEARWLDFLGLHKQLANRWMEPAGHITVIVSATDWDNFFHLRTHRMAQPEFQDLAKKMKAAYDASTPEELLAGQWHMPLIFEEDYDLALAIVNKMTDAEREAEYMTGKLPCAFLSTTRDWVTHILRKVSVGRCARVSYLTHDGKRDLLKDIELHDRLLAGVKTNEPLHMSPFEHVAMATSANNQSGNIRGYIQLRKLVPGEGGPTA